MQRTPENYIKAAAIAKESSEEMLSRLEWMTLQPEVIVEIGCRSGKTSRKLKKRYPNAQVIALDNAEMIDYAKQQTLNHPIQFVCNDGENIPLRTHSVDLLFINLLFPWLKKKDNLFQEWHRLLKPNGLLLFTALGPNTLKEWQPIFGQYLIPDLVDMHDIGDALLQQKFDEPVLDVNYYTLAYQNSGKFIFELSVTGMLDSSFQPNLVQDKKLSATFEVIFAHAFLPKEISFPTQKNEITKVPLSHLRQQLKNGLVV